MKVINPRSEDRPSAKKLVKLVLAIAAIIFGVSLIGFVGMGIVGVALVILMFDMFREHWGQLKKKLSERFNQTRY